MKLGIVGLPNVGKSTLFNAITSTKNAEAANYPFCTIEPNSGIVAVPDKRLDKLAEVWQTNKKTPAIVEFVDIAGLVKGASQGAGLGNKFLGHIRECDAIVHVVRCFDDDNIVHVAGKVDPIADIETIGTELALADLASVEKAIVREGKRAKSGDKEAQKLVAVLELARRALAEQLKTREIFDTPGSLKQYLQLQLGARPHEVFAVVFLDSQHRLLALEELFRDTLTQTSVYPREVVLRALHHNAAAVVLAHNHPSGSVQPSRSDGALTQTLKSALALVDVRVLDHIIVAPGCALSMAEQGLV
mgnify:CR=1 FL=1